MSVVAGSAAPDEVFREVTPAPVWLRMIGVLVLVAAVLLVVDALFIDPRSFAGGGAVAAVVATVVLLAIGALLVRVRMIVVVTAPSGAAARGAAASGASGGGGELLLALPPVWRVRIPLSDVAGGPADLGGAGAPSLCDITLREFGGVGYRALPGHRRALLLSSGRAVVVSRLSTGLSYTVRTDRSVELVTAIVGTSAKR